MDFAKKILNKYGWKEGDGLGKNNDGIAKPLTASLKFDNAGLGADQAASDFNNHWWNRIYNEATQNIEIKKSEKGKVSMELKAADAVEISTKGYSTKKLKKAKQNAGSDNSSTHYNNFLQMATLSNGGCEIENPNKISSDDISVTQYKILTDEELFKACGGRTAHKGARHGLKLSGKLARLEQQEQMLLEKMKKNESHEMEKNLKVDVLNDDQLNSVDKKPKKLKRKSENINEDFSKFETKGMRENNQGIMEYVKPKKKKREAEICDDFTNKNVNAVEHSSEDKTGTSPMSKKLKKKKRKESAPDSSTESTINGDSLVESNKVETKQKKQKTKVGNFSDKSVPDTIPEVINEVPQLSKKKKNKNKEVQEDSTDDIQKKSKKKKKNKEYSNDVEIET